ncbi:HlyIII-domain-containing protein [Zopfia rhizophila CBS 207.26]|uniref:HlyIII-domain-containing protein n=1 Tax=Zopfia rhizophila CBS 207.26 TaxID=1314779 RepID=A0A6A6E3P5_9PEZI|nr:HlyIII-domain-containing protein [Zopfia rhizophila CBS 207.26]
MSIESPRTPQQSRTPEIHGNLRLRPGSKLEKEWDGTKGSLKRTTLLHWNSLPQWQRGNSHIHTGYRPASSSFLVSFHSLFYLHNETVNIYTHLLPSLVIIPFSGLLYCALSPRYATATHADIIVFSCFFASAAFCLGMSATYHTISNHSPLVARIGNAFDYVGIVGLITGSFIPSMYYVFYCQPHLQWTYWGMISGIGLGCAAVSIIPRFRTPEWRATRATMFVSLGLSAVFPVSHGLWLFGFEQMRTQIGLDWVLLQGSLYILGATIYAERVPERLRPGKFDVLGSSHQIFHVLVVLAVLAHLKGLLKAFDFRHSGMATQCKEAYIPMEPYMEE